MLFLLYVIFVLMLHAKSYEFRCAEAIWCIWQLTLWLDLICMCVYQCVRVCVCIQCVSVCICEDECVCMTVCTVCVSLSLSVSLCTAFFTCSFSLSFSLPLSLPFHSDLHSVLCLFLASTTHSFWQPTANMPIVHRKALISLSSHTHAHIHTFTHTDTNTHARTHARTHAHAHIGRILWDFSECEHDTSTHNIHHFRFSVHPKRLHLDPILNTGVVLHQNISVIPQYVWNYRQNTLWKHTEHQNSSFLRFFGLSSFTRKWFSYVSAESCKTIFSHLTAKRWQKLSGTNDMGIVSPTEITQHCEICTFNCDLYSILL